MLLLHTSVLLSLFVLFDLTICEIIRQLDNLNYPWKDVITGNQTRQAKTFNFTSMYPGTNWCGAGNIATNYNDLGYYREADKCCRQHDHCKNVILAQEIKHGLLNNGFFTALDCHCDDIFRKCLQSSCSAVALHIGVKYFNALQLQCFTYDHPLEFSVVSQKYIRNEREPERWQWIFIKPITLREAGDHIVQCFGNGTLEILENMKNAMQNIGSSLEYIFEKNVYNEYIVMLSELYE